MANRSVEGVGAPPSAEELRIKLLEEQLAKIRKDEDARDKERAKLAAFTDDFLQNHVTDAEIAMVRRLVQAAVENGKFEALVYSFPSSLCTDSGRAINSADPDWPQTLQGKAREFYERYEEFGRSRGYKLKAMIINFPGGLPGDVGLFLSWAPEAK
jgi:hypothetical protein